MFEEREIPGTELLIDNNNLLSQEHTGDVVLIPPPTNSTRDPLTWSRPKKYWHLFLLAFYACSFSFAENTLGAAWTTVSEDTNVSIANMNGGSALNYLLLGFINIFWIPAAMKIGRRFVFCLSTAFCLGGAVWNGAFSGTAQWYLACILGGIGTSAYEAVIQLSIFDTFFAHERGRALSVYLFGQQLGSVVGLISGGNIADSVGWRWSQYISAISNGVVLVLFFFTFDETSFPRFAMLAFSKIEFLRGENSAEKVPSENSKGDHKDLRGFENSDSKSINTAKAQEIPANLGANEHDVDNDHAYVSRNYWRRLSLWTLWPEDKTTFWEYFRRPFFIFLFPNVLISGLMFSCGCSAGILSFNTISEIVTESPYNFSTTQAGLICFGAFVGNIVGYLTSYLSDHVVLFVARRNNGIKEPEARLYVIIIPFIYAASGYMMYGWGSQKEDPWPVIAVGLALLIAHQVSISGIATAYAMECFQGIGGEITVVLAICSSLINFAFSYSIQPFVDTSGYGPAFTFYGGIVWISMILGIPTIIFGKRWRIKCASRYYKFLDEKEQT